MERLLLNKQLLFQVPAPTAAGTGTGEGQAQKDGTVYISTLSQT